MEQKKTMTTAGVLAAVATIGLTGCGANITASADYGEAQTGGVSETVRDTGDVVTADRPEDSTAIEVSFDGGETWAEEEGVAVFTLADIVDTDGPSKSEPFLEETVVDGYVETYFQVRAAEGESAVVYPDNVSVVYTGDEAGENHYGYYVQSVDGLDIEGAVGSDGNFTENGQAVIAADGSPTDFVVGFYADEHADGDVDADFEIIAVADDTE